MENEKGKVFGIPIIMSKAISAPTCILLGLVFKSSFLVIYGAGLGAIGLLMFSMAALSYGLRPTLRSCRSILKEFSDDIKPLIRKLRGLSDQKCPECGHWIPKKVRVYWCRATDSGVTSYEAFNCQHCGHKFRDAISTH